MSRTSPVTATANPMLDALEQIWAVCLDNKSDRCNHKMALDFVRQIAGKAVSTANSDGHAQSSKEPVAYRWRQPGNKHWIYDPTPEWIEDHKHEIDLEALYTLSDTSTLGNSNG